MIRKGLMLSFIPLAIMLALGAWGYFASPADAQYPVHWGLDGRPDRYGGPLETFLGLFAIGLAITLLLAVIPLFDPRAENIRRSEPFYLTVWMAVLWFMALLQTALTLTSLGYVEGGEDMMVRLTGSALGVLLLVVGNMLGKSRPNWFAGVRTPWTLSSDLSWEKTHRLTGRMFVLVGVAGAVGAWLAPASVFMPAIVGGVVTASVVAVVYSWMVWRTAPDRRNGQA